MPGAILGTSPHLRGNPYLTLASSSERRDIPAPTGQPIDYCLADVRLTGHPRTYGATTSAHLATLDKAGTSPHLRGNQRIGQSKRRAYRDIPAPTGQPRKVSFPRRSDRGHPRTYGATTYAILNRDGDAGTSPHLRGNRRSHTPDRGLYRDIPAPTGQPASQGRRTRPCRGHPRTYGATLTTFKRAQDDKGTSPHLRGNHIAALNACVDARDIPAPTGQPLTWPIEGEGLRGHPRTYGATASVRVSKRSGAGTSPHLRGNLLHRHHSLELDRDIPAPTGQPAAGVATSQPPSGHPRTYGATSMSAEVVLAC